MPDQIEMPARVRKYLMDKFSEIKIDGFEIKKVLGSGNTAVTYEVKDKNGLPWALKLVTRESYGDRAPFREIGRFARAKDKRFLVFPEEVGDYSLKLGSKTYDFIWFKSRCVEGQTLKSYFESKLQFSAKNEILKYIENITAALDELQRLKFCHGDLHDRNIMREEIGKGGLLPEVRYVIIDFSEAHAIDNPQERLSRDFENFGKHLRSFSDVIQQRDFFTREDEKILTSISHIPGLLNGTAPESMGISRASQIAEIFWAGLRSTYETPQKLRTPFESLSAEYILNDTLFAALCYTKTPWVTDLEANKNILLIGPRGCGKTMIFRRFRLKTKIAAKKTKEIKEDPYIGFYLPCESLFYMRFSDLSEHYVKKHLNALILYFNMAVLAEVSSTLSVLPEYLGPVSKNLPVTLGKLLRDEIQELWEELMLPPETTNLAELTSFADAIMRHVHKSISYERAIKYRGSTDFVSRLVSVVKKEIPALSGRYFIFFLDDYTEERVPLALQEALHPTVVQRSSDLCFKVSAHMFGSIYNSPRPLALDEGRNILVINIGSAYLKSKKRRREGQILLKILNERFKNCEDYNGTIEDWLGKRSYPNGVNLSRALHDPDLRPQVHYHGYQTLIDLCTGDYSEMIRLVDQIFKEAGIKSGSPIRQISSADQDRAIDRVSREYLGRIRHIQDDGQKLFDITNAFGNLSKRLLYERDVGQGMDSKGQPRRDPYDVLTIYVDDLTIASPDARKMWERLQQASIFVDIGLAPSQRKVIADRATLRRIYCPAFRTTFTSSEHLQVSKDKFEWFMDKPDEFCEAAYKSRVPEKTYQSPLIREKVEEESRYVFPDEKNQLNFDRIAPKNLINVVTELPELQPLGEVIKAKSKYNLYLGAFGFEDRTTEAVAALARHGVRVKNAILMEFDMYLEANEQNRDKYEKCIMQLTSGKAHRPLNAPVSSHDANFPQRVREILETLAKSKIPKILFDCTSCPSIILSETLRVLFEFDCDLTVLYSEAAEYFPSKSEWEAGEIKPHGKRVRGPFAGVEYVTKPILLQADDTGEFPVSLILFPTFNTERTDGILADLVHATRIWLFGEPHDLQKNLYRIEMAKTFAAPIMHQNDPWSLLSTFDYKKTLLALGGVYKKYHSEYRLVVMPHGSKMQTLAVNLFAAVHQVSMVFAMPKTYKPSRYSKGCKQVWGIPLGETQSLIKKLRAGRVLRNNKISNEKSILSY